ncbi:MAG: response regulator [Saprospiraceae bacterium]|nr:response regulator [Saprospiraceae bacterium]
MKGRFSIQILIILLTLIELPLNAQRKFEWLNTSNGLSQGYVYDILQDKDGFMWFSTKAGLNRYDGYSFKVFTHNAYDSNSISSDNVSRLFEDSQDRIWILTDDNGINIYNKINGKFFRIVHDPNNSNSLSGNRVSSEIIELNDGRFITYSSQKGFNVISLPKDYFEKRSKVHIVRIPAPQENTYIPLVKDAKSRIWITCGKKLYQFIPERLEFEWRKDNIEFSNPYKLNSDGSLLMNGESFNVIEFENGFQNFPIFSKSITNSQVSTFMNDKNNNLWIGIPNLNLLSIYDINKWKRGILIDPIQSLNFIDSGVAPMKIVEDKSGIVWLGTNGYGIRKYRQEEEKFRHLARGFSARKIINYNKEEILIRGWGKGLRYSTNGKILPFPPHLSKGNIHDYFVSKDGKLWLINMKNIENRNFIVNSLEELDVTTRKKRIFPVSLNISYDALEPIFEDNHGYLWICGINGEILILQPENGKIQTLNLNSEGNKLMLTNAFITSLYEDTEGLLWIGTEEGFAIMNYNYLNQTTTSIKWYRNNSLDKNSLNYNHVTSFLEDPLNKDLMWISTKGGGLNRYEKSTGKFEHLTTKVGLCNNVVYGILSDSVGNIWGSTNKGIFCLLRERKDELNKWLFRHFTKISGLQDDEFNTGAFCKLSNGDLAFGGVNGISIFNPLKVLENGYEPNVFITNILSGNETVSPNDITGILTQTIEHTQSISLNHLQDILTLEFSSLDFTSPEKNKYRYQLIGIDKNWVESGTRRSATYLHLPAGNYTFKVQGSNSEGMWSKNMAQLQIKVLPPWWNSWWAYSLYITILVLAVRSYFKFNINKAKLQSQLNYEHKEAKRVKELDAVKTQLYANITHEFRTPLTVILGMASQLKNNPEKYLQSGIDMIVRNGENLLNLVNEMLDLSKLESGKMNLNLIKGDIISFLRYIVESFQSLAISQKKQFHFLADIDELYVEYDSEKIRQIITNLFSNALKFTPEFGNVYVNVSKGDISIDNNSLLVIKVKDTGIGIPEDQVMHVFDRFYQVNNTQTRNAEGTGIGLALTKELVKLMNGTISVKSPPVGATKGTEFIINIPLVNIKHDIHPDENNPKSILIDLVSRANFNSDSKSITSENINSNRELILLVEDNTDVVAYTASCLPDYKLAVGKDGKEGFDIAIEVIPNLIITDVMMPNVDGFEMCNKLRNDERTSHIPIIMLTAKADFQSKLEGLEKGADAYLEKPFHKDELLLRIKKLLEQRKNLQYYYSKKIGIQDNSMIHSESEEIIEEKAENEFVKKVREIVEANFVNYEFSVDQICKQIYMSHSQLHRKLDALTGFSPNQFIRYIRLKKAKELLVNPTLSITFIAMESGYNDPGYFTRVFKQEEGITPQEWRNTKIF